MKETNMKEKLHRGLVIKYFWQVIKNFKFSFFIVTSFSVLVSVLDVYIPLQFLKLWNILSTNDFSFVEEAKNVILVILFLGLFRWGLKRVVGFSNIYFQANVIAGLRKQAFSYMMGHSHAFFSNNFGGSLTQKINKYAKSFERIMDRVVNEGIPLVIKSVGTIVAIYTLDHKYAFILTIFCIVFLSTALVYTRFKLKYDIAAALLDTKTTGVVADSISNHSSVLLFAGHEYEGERVGSVIKEQKKGTLINWFLWEGLGSIQSLYVVAAEFIIFWSAIGDWKLGILSVPVIILIQSYLGRLMENLWGFAGIVRAFYDGFSDAEEMVRILDTPYDVKDNDKAIFKDVKGEILFDNVTYIYDKNNTKVFDDFCLKISSGEKIALVGSSGAGKSTFVNLLMRLFDVTSGRILIDGIDISFVSQKNLREQISFVPQDPVLFHRTLLENIRYGRRGATEEEVKRAASLARCDDFINKLPLGFDTFVGERGVKLSGGERQRVAIARAILKNAPILILDEATSALDSESELLIQEALHNLIKNKTTIIIAHRLSTIKSVDRIVVISSGKIVEEGKHEDLTSLENGEYRKLWDIQAGGFSSIID